MKRKVILIHAGKSLRRAERHLRARAILHCGVCHSALHQARNEWHNSVYPVVPGHEIVGRVVKTGSAVKKFKEGDLAAVGCMVGSCGVCSSCSEGLEQYCE